MTISERFCSGDPVICAIYANLPRVNPELHRNGGHPDLICIDESQQIYKWNFDGAGHYAKFDSLPPYRNSRDFRIRFYDDTGKFYCAMFFNRNGKLKDVQLRLFADASDYHNPDLKF